MIIDHLPTGSVFSFLWNLMVSISFQFVGFLLTYLLHTTHAARFGSRAGLGVTLIQYGFALRAARPEDDLSTNGWWGVGGGGAYGNGAKDDAKPTFGTKEDAEDYYRKLNITMVDGMPSGTIPGATMDDVNFANEATTDWLSFFLMTIGASRFPPPEEPHSSLFSRLVYPHHFAAKLLARQALGTQHPCISSRNDRFCARRSGQQPVTPVFGTAAPDGRFAHT